MYPGFGERAFEFCYNAEFCHRNDALLATHPHIPTQREEGDLGYDVEFEIAQQDFEHSLFLQHKVASFAENRVWNNVQFYDSHNGPYYRFKVDRSQHNTLVELDINRGDAYYCSPLFHSNETLESHFRGETIYRNSVLIEPSAKGEINDDEVHNMTYDPNGQRRFLHSESTKMSGYAPEGDDLPEMKSQEVDKDYVFDLSESLSQLTLELKNKLPSRIESLSPTQKTQYILGRVYNVSWILM